MCILDENAEQFDILICFLIYFGSLDPGKTEFVSKLVSEVLETF